MFFCLKTVVYTQRAGILFGVILSEDSIISSLWGITFGVDCQGTRSYLQCGD